MEPGDEIVSVEAGPLDEADKELHEFFQNVQKDSLKTLEEAARQMIGLSTTLLGLYFGVLAFQDVPGFWGETGIKLLGAFSAGAFLAGLFFALDVIMPREIAIPTADLTRMRALLEKLYKRKSRSLQWAQYAFGCGALYLLGMIIWLLFTR